MRKADSGAVANLKNASEELSVLNGLLGRELERVGNEAEYAAKAKKSVDDAIYQLTGEEFYRAKGCL